MVKGIWYDWKNNDIFLVKEYKANFITAWLDSLMWGEKPDYYLIAMNYKYPITMTSDVWKEYFEKCCVYFGEL